MAEGLYLGSFESVESLEDYYKAPLLFGGSHPRESGFPEDIEYPLDLQGIMGTVYRNKKKVTAENLNIRAVVTVGFSDISPADLQMEGIDQICTECFSEMSTGEFLNLFGSYSPQLAA